MWFKRACLPAMYLKSWAAQDQLLPMRSVGGWWQFLQRKGGESGRQGGRWKGQELFREWTWQAWVTTPSAFWSEWDGGTIQQKREFKWETGLGVKSDKCDLTRRVSNAVEDPGDEVHLQTCFRALGSHQKYESFTHYVHSNINIEWMLPMFWDLF